MFPFLQGDNNNHNNYLNKTDQLPLSKPLLNIYNSIALGNAIYTVYCSCQAEVNEESFLKLLLENNKEIWGMVMMAGCPKESIKIDKKIVLAYLERISSLTFNYKSLGSRSNIKTPIVKAVQAKGKCYNY